MLETQLHQTDEETDSEKRVVKTTVTLVSTQYRPCSLFAYGISLNLIPTGTLQIRYFNRHFADKETKAQRGESVAEPRT